MAEKNMMVCGFRCFSLDALINASCRTIGYLIDNNELEYFGSPFVLLMIRRNNVRQAWADQVENFSKDDLHAKIRHKISCIGSARPYHCPLQPS
jgi:hypothetical protein